MGKQRFYCKAKSYKKKSYSEQRPSRQNRHIARVRSLVNTRAFTGAGCKSLVKADDLSTAFLSRARDVIAPKDATSKRNIIRVFRKKSWTSGNIGANPSGRIT